MPLTSDLKAHYEAVMHDMEAERNQLQEKIAPLQSQLKDLHIGIAMMAKRINPEPIVQSIMTPVKSSQRYANLSVRWAILDLLNESEGMTTTEIADALMKAGVRTRAANFANNVSAVVTTTLKDQGEVRALPEGKWELTERGKSVIAHIRTTPKFLDAVR